MKTPEPPGGQTPDTDRRRPAATARPKRCPGLYGAQTRPRSAAPTAPGRPARRALRHLRVRHPPITGERGRRLTTNPPATGQNGESGFRSGQNRAVAPVRGSGPENPCAHPDQRIRLRARGNHHTNRWIRRNICNINACPIDRRCETQPPDLGAKPCRLRTLRP